EHFEAARLKTFQLWAFFDHVEIVAVNRVDRILFRFHLSDVIVERYEPVAGGGAKPGEPQQLVAMVTVLVKAFLEHGPEIIPKFGILVRRLAGLLRKFAQYLPCQLLANSRDHGVRLQHLATDVERQVLAITDAAQEP